MTVDTGWLGLPLLDHVHHCRAEELLAALPDSSVDAIITDPPYYKVKDCAWDRQWDTPGAFLEWIGGLCKEWQRVLKPNGSLYVFASPKMAARVEVEIGRWFEVLNNIRWVKDAGWHNKTRKEDVRSFLSPWEAIIFAEHFGADNAAKGESGYGQACDRLRGFVFEPLRAYLDGERMRAGLTPQQVSAVLGNFMYGHYFTRSQWALPTAANYAKLREGFNRLGPPPNGSGEYLRREYEYLRREYEDLRRPFSVSADVPYTDVWDFPTVGYYPGKHPAEKPAAMMEHIITASTKPGAIVLDTFAGSGATLKAAKKLGRRFIGCDMSDHWAAYARTGLQDKPTMTVLAQPERAYHDLPLFSWAMEAAR